MSISISLSVLRIFCNSITAFLGTIHDNDSEESFREEIIKQERKYIDNGGNLVFHLPKFHIINKYNYKKFLNKSFKNLSYKY